MAHERPTPAQALAVVSAVVTGTVVGALLVLCGYGLDFTDEGYYLNSITNPGLYPATTSQFGFVYRPLAALLGNDIALLRRANVLLTFALGSAAAHAVLRPHNLASSRWQGWVLSASIGSGSLVILSMWLITPNYNTLSLQAALLILAGVGVQQRPGRRAALLAVGAIGLGGTLAFLAKPTTAIIALPVLVVLLVTPGRPLRLRLALLSASAGVAVVGLVVSALLIDHSIASFLDRLTVGTEMLRTLGGGHTRSGVLRWDDFDPGGVLLSIQAAAIAAIVLVTLAGSAPSWKVRVPVFALASVCALGACLVAVLHRGVWTVGNPYLNTLLLTIPAAAFLIAVRAGLGALRNIRWGCWTLGGLLIASPHLIAFGTNGNYWSGAGLAGMPWALAGVLLLSVLPESGLRSSGLTTVSLVIPVFAGLLILPGVQSPYRQPPGVVTGSAPIAVGAAGSLVRIDKEAADFLGSSGMVLADAGFVPGTGMLDLTGRSPGLLFAWGATAQVQPWDIGGYPGSPDLTSDNLARTPCDRLSSMWVLVEPVGTRAIPTDVLATMGARFPEDYVLAAQWDVPPSVTAELAPVQQVAYRPRRSPADALSACQDLRKGKP
jgi:hypothetical protein